MPPFGRGQYPFDACGCRRLLPWVAPGIHQEDNLSSFGPPQAMFQHDGVSEGERNPSCDLHRTLPRVGHCGHKGRKVLNPRTRVIPCRRLDRVPDGVQKGGYTVSCEKCPAQVVKPVRSINSSFIPWPLKEKCTPPLGVSCASVPLAFITRPSLLVQTAAGKL